MIVCVCVCVWRVRVWKEENVTYYITYFCVSVCVCVCVCLYVVCDVRTQETWREERQISEETIASLQEQLSTALAASSHELHVPLSGHVPLPPVDAVT